MAEKRVIEIEVNTKGAVKSMDALEKATNDVSKSFADVYGDLQPLTTRMGEAEDRLYELANAGKTTTQEYKDLLKTVGEFRKVQISTDMAVDAAATTMGQKLGGALGGVSSGFTVVSGVMGAFGTQSEEVEKALLKVQSAMAIQQGIQGVKESITSFRELGAVIKATSIYQAAYNFVQTGSITATTESTVAKVADAQATVAQGTATVATTTATAGASVALKVLRAALISTGVGALVVGLGMLIANLDSIIGFFSGATNANLKNEAAIKKNTAALNAQIKASDKSSEALKTKNGHELNMAKATGASAEAIRKLTLKHADEAIALDKASLATARNTYEKEKNTLANMVANGVSDELIEKQRELVKKARENVTEERKDLVKSYEEKKAVVRNNEVEIAQEIFDKKQKVKENTKKEGKELINITKNIEDEKLRLQEDGLKKELDGLKLKYARKKEEEDKQLKEKTLTQKDYETLQKQAIESFEFDKKQIVEKYVNQESELKTVLSRNAIQGLVDSSKTRLEIEKATSEKSIEISKEEAEKKQKIEEKKIQMGLTALSILNDAFQMSAGKSEKDQRKAFKAQKAFNLASALTNTYLAVASALALNPKDSLFPGQRFVEAGLAGAAGAVQVAKIASTQFTSSATSADTGGGGGGGGATAPTMSAPQFNVVGQSGVNQLASLNQQPIQAYVVSGQVTSQQALDRNRLANATLGG